MAVVLEGGCRITGIRGGEPTINGTLTVWPQIGRATNASAICLRTMEFAPGLSETVAWYRAREDWWRPLKSGEFRDYYERHYGRRLSA